jgi:hypothetical protein
MTEFLPDSITLLKSIFVSEMDHLPGSVCQFLFSPDKDGYHNRATILDEFYKGWAAFETNPEENVSQSLREIFFPSKPYDLTIIENLSYLEFSIIQDLCIAKILKDISTKRHPQVTPQLYIELLNYYNQRAPEFQILVDPLLHLIRPEGDPSIMQGIKTRACAVLINHFEIETLIIYISCHLGLQEKEKQTFFQSLTAFQKIYRKFLELQDDIGNKDLISQKWFGEDFERLKKRGRYRDSFSNLVGRFLELLQVKNKRDALQVGRFLVLRFNNEDILRILHSKMESGDLKNNFLLKNFIYRQIYSIMQEFRKEYISQKVDSELTQFLSEMETQNFESMRLVTVGVVPAQVILQGLIKEEQPFPNYPFNPELLEKMKQFHLSALFDLFPVSPRAQEIMLTLSRIAENLDLQKEELVKFITYLERELIFLQQLEEMGIHVLSSPLYGLILNPFQMKSLSLIFEGGYYASTGYWMRSTVPPGLIRCINLNAIPNCLGVLDRHIFSRISLLTGAFRGTPFDLDSTNRYDWDEEPETCQIRPGYFLLDIPPTLTQSWEKIQALQQEALQEKIKRKDWG